MARQEADHAIAKPEMAGRLAELDDRPAEGIQSEGLDPKSACQDSVRGDLTGTAADRSQEKAERAQRLARSIIDGRLARRLLCSAHDGRRALSIGAASTCRSCGAAAGVHRPKPSEA
jgi:hypothetical protein